MNNRTLYHKQWRKDNKDKVKSYRATQAHKSPGYVKKFRGTFKGIAWNLILSDVDQRPLVCHYTGKALTFDTGKINSISLDRLNASMGYEPNNVVFCCNVINRMKWEFDVPEFIDMCTKVANNCWQPISNPAQHNSNQVISQGKLSTRFSNCKSRAKRIGREFSLDYTDISTRPFNCFYTGEPLTCEPNKPNTVSFDRLNNAIGYTKDNTVLCCHHVNLMKQEMSLVDFFDTCKLISEAFPAHL